MRLTSRGRLASAAALVVLGALICAQGAEAAGFTRRPYLNSVDTGSAVISFQLDAACASTVKYGAGTDLSQTAQSASSKNHAVKLTGLAPGTQYSYAIEACGAAMGDTDTFQTATGARATKVHFAALGDMGTGIARQTDVANAMHAAKPEFWVSLGDNAYSSGTASEYTSYFFKPMAEMLEDVPTFPANGNHEYVTDQAQPYLDAFVLPTNNPQGTERYYSFDWGPVHMVAIDSQCAADYDTGSCDGAAQLAWLKADLAATTRPWKIVYMHHPPYSNGEHASNTKIRQLVSPILEQYGVDLVLTGHDHHYERTKPVRAGALDEAKGITHFVVGTGGAALRSTPTSANWSAFRSSVDNGFLDVTIDGGTLTAKFIKHDGKVVDSYTRTKEVAPPVEPTLTVAAEPSSGTVPLRTSLNAQTSLKDAAFAWELPGGKTATGATVNLELTEPGSYTATVTATGEGTTLSQSVGLAANAAGCEATNSCLTPDAGTGTDSGSGSGGNSGGFGGDSGGEEGPSSGCGATGALLLPMGALGLLLRRRRR